VDLDEMFGFQELLLAIAAGHSWLTVSGNAGADLTECSRAGALRGGSRLRSGALKSVKACHGPSVRDRP
jgi:hypothetical protein